jgi:hypothetical protein
MASEPVYTWHPDMITLRQAEALTNIDYKRIHDAARHGHIYWNRYDVAPTFRVSKRDTLKWAASRKAA